MVAVKSIGLAGAGVVGAIGLLLFGIGLLVDPRQALHSYLTAYIAALGLALGALIMVMISHLTGAVWFRELRRAAEAIAVVMPVLAVLFLPLLLGRHWLYPWAGPAADLAEPVRESIEARRGYLNAPFFAARAAVYFALWIVAALLLRRWSMHRDRSQDDGSARRQRVMSAAALPAVALTMTFAAFDWVMSLSAEWFSTVYGVYVFAGGFVAALAALAAVAPGAQRAGLLHPVSIDSTHALGTLLFAALAFWLYIGFSQFLIIWIADVPAEVAWYLPRLRTSWAAVAGLLLLGHFLGPFLLLLMRRVKRAPGALAGVGAWLLVMHYVDVYWLVAPQLHIHGVRLHWLDLGALCGVAGIVFATAGSRLRHQAFAAPGARLKHPAG